MSRTPPGAVGASYNHAPVTEAVAWQSQGACRHYDPELFQPNSEIDAAVPKAICRHCPVMMECRGWALEKHEVYGVWGGLSESERASVWAGRRIRYRRRTA